MSFSRRIFLALVLVQLASAALVAGWYFYILRPELIGLTRQGLQNSVVGSIEAISEYLHPAETLADAAHYLLAEDVIAIDQPDKLERYFVAQLRALPEIAGLYVGYPDGTFFYVMMSDEESAGGTRTKIVRQRPGGREVELTWRDSDFSIVKKELDTEDQYDPRTRDWYGAAIASEGHVWTEPYVFFTSGKPGITLAYAIRNADGTASSVLGIDIEISEISGFLTRNSLGVNGSAYIVTEKGQVIAHSSVSSATLGGGQSGDTPRFRTISELGGVEGALEDRILEQFTHRSDSTRMAIWDTAIENTAYFVAVGQMANANWPWQVVVIAPSAIEQGALYSAGTMFYVSIFIALALACTAGYAVSRSVGQPIEHLRANARQARHGNIEIMEPVETSAKEIAEIDDALRHLAALSRAQRGSTEPPHSG